MWFFFYPPPQDPVGAGVEFENGKVVAVFTLGGPAGWHTETGIKVGEILSSQFDGKSKGKWLSCAGYSAQLTHSSGELRDVDPHAGRGGLRLRADPAVRLALSLSSFSFWARSSAAASTRPSRASSPQASQAGEASATNGA